MTTTAMVSPLAVFDALQRGDVAPAWLAAGVCDAWALDADRTEIRLIAVSENATFRIAVDGDPVAVLRVHRPGHVGEAWHVVFRFDTPAHLAVWERSPARVAHLDAGDEFVHATDMHRVSGLETWFALPGRTAPAPPPTTTTSPPTSPTTARWCATPILTRSSWRHPPTCTTPWRLPRWSITSTCSARSRWRATWRKRKTCCASPSAQPPSPW